MNEAITTLDKLNFNKKARIINVNTNETMKKRLIELGIIKGTPVSLFFKSPFGEPSAYLFQDSLIALRNEDSSKIEVEYK